jgi:hypothetical protein
MVVLLLIAVAVLAPFSMFQLSYATLAQDNQISGKYSGSSWSQSFSHSAGVLVIISLCDYYTASTSVHWGSNSATKLNQTGSANQFWETIWYYYDANAGPDTLTATVTTGLGYFVTSYSGVPSSAPYFEHGNGNSYVYGGSDTVNVAAGTTNRKVIYGVCNGQNGADRTINAASGFTDQGTQNHIASVYLGTEYGYDNTASSVSAGSSGTTPSNNYQYWDLVAVAILPAVILTTTMTISMPLTMTMAESRSAESFARTVSQPVTVSFANSKSAESLTRTITLPITQNVIVNRSPQSLTRAITQYVLMPASESFTAYMNATWYAGGNLYSAVSYTRISGTEMRTQVQPSSQGWMIIHVGVWVSFPRAFLDGKLITVTWDASWTGPYSTLAAIITDGYGNWDGTPLQTLFTISSGQSLTQNATVACGSASNYYVTLSLLFKASMYDYTGHYYFDVDSIHVNDNGGSGYLYRYNEFADDPVILGSLNELQYGYVGYNVDTRLSRTVALTRGVTQPITVSASVSQTQFLNPGGSGGVSAPWAFFIMLGGIVTFAFIVIVWRRRRSLR